MICFEKISTKKITHRVISSALALLMAGGVWFSGGLSVSASLTREETLAMQQAKTIETNSIPGWPDGPVVSADSAILMDADTGAVLYAKNIHARQYPASTTKLLTSLIAVEHCSLDEIVTFSHSAVFDTPRDSNHIAIDVGEELTMEQALNAVLIRSANEVTFAVAEHMTGTTWQDFAPIMNQRAKDLGCLDSNFVNPNGLPDENHYTTAYDLALIGRAAFANELIRKISTSKVLRIPPSAKQPDDIIEYSGNDLLPGKKYGYEYLTGTKTGFTIAARSSLVSSAEKDGMRLICVILRDEAPFQYEDTIALFDYGFSNFDKINVSQTETKYNIDNSNFFYSSNDIFGSSKPILSLNTEDSIILPKTASFEDTVSSLTYETQAENEVAMITYTYQGQYVGSVSVDIAAGNTASFAFESERFSGDSLESPSYPEVEPEEEAKPEPEENIIFINVVKMFLWVLGVAGGIILLIIVHSLLNNYQFSAKDRRGRRVWRKSKRVKRNLHQIAARRRQTTMHTRQKKRAKRASRLRDFDF